MEKIILKNGISLIYKKATNTPRVAVCCDISIGKQETTPGTYAILNRLLTQGTQTRNAEQLAEEFEKNGIDLYTEMKSDYWKFSALALNEDFEIAMELLSDIMQNSTLENFEKEVTKFKGETIASLDSPSAKARDTFVENLYKNHQYGHTGTVILNTIDQINKEEIKSAYNALLYNSKKVFSIIGDIEKEKVVEILEKYFGKFNSTEINNTMFMPELGESKVVTVTKNDVQQAQIYQGWLVPSHNHEDSPALSVLNTILGSSGLSSRLFLELRDKKGLAYTVRSIYNKNRMCGDFRVYIATEPKNIKTSLRGFKIEIDKLKNELVSEKELFDAKNNIIGKLQFLTETNQQKAGTTAFYELENLGYEHLEKWIDKINQVSSEDIKRVANMYLGEINMLMVLAPEKYLAEV